MGILMAMLFPALVQGRMRARRVQCVSNLRQIGIGFQSFAHEHNGLFPMAVPAGAGGSQEFAQNVRLVPGDSYFSFRHFQVLSNDVVTPKLLVCPADTRLPATNFAFLRNENLSFFVSPDAQYSKPNSILSGDRNLTNYWAPSATRIRLAVGGYLAWTPELHRFKGNLLFSDGHVEQNDDPRSLLPNSLASASPELVLPTVLSPGATRPVLESRGSTPGRPGTPKANIEPVAEVARKSFTNDANGARSNWVMITTTPVPKVPVPALPAGGLTSGGTSSNKAVLEVAREEIRVGDSVGPDPKAAPLSTLAGGWFAALAEGVLKDFVWGWYVALALLLALTILVRRKFLKMAEEKRRREAQ